MATYGCSMNRKSHYGIHGYDIKASFARNWSEAVITLLASDTHASIQSLVYLLILESEGNQRQNRTASSQIRQNRMRMKPIFKALIIILL